MCRATTFAKFSASTSSISQGVLLFFTCIHDMASSLTSKIRSTQRNIQFPCISQGSRKRCNKMAQQAQPNKRNHLKLKVHHTKKGGSHKGITHLFNYKRQSYNWGYSKSKNNWTQRWEKEPRWGYANKQGKRNRGTCLRSTARPKSSQFLGSLVNGQRSAQKLVFGYHIGVVWIHPVRALNVNGKKCQMSSFQADFQNSGFFFSWNLEPQPQSCSCAAWNFKLKL